MRARHLAARPATSPPSWCAHTRARAHAHAHAHTHNHMHTHTHIHTRIFTCTRTRMHVHARMHARTYTHVHIPSWCMMMPWLKKRDGPPDCRLNVHWPRVRMPREKRERERERSSPRLTNTPLSWCTHDVVTRIIRARCLPSIVTPSGWRSCAN